MTVALFISVLLIAACGLVYELVASALASYLLGDSILQFSTVIGTYLFAMGIGSWMSRYITRGLVTRFVTIELMVGMVGGLSSMLLFLTFALGAAMSLAAVISLGTRLIARVKRAGAGRYATAALRSMAAALATTPTDSDSSANHFSSSTKWQGCFTARCSNGAVPTSV